MAMSRAASAHSPRTAISAHFARKFSSLKTRVQWQRVRTATTAAAEWHSAYEWPYDFITPIRAMARDAFHQGAAPMRLPSVTSLIVILAATAGTATADEVRRSHRFDTTGIEHLHIEHRAGELTLAPADGDQIEVELRIEPEQEWIDREGDVADLDLTSSVRGDRLTLSFSERNVHSYMLVRLPSLKQLTIDAGAGEVEGTVPPMETEVLLGAGTVNLDFDRFSTGRIDLRAGIGDTAVDGAQNVETNRVVLVGSTSSATGEGSHRVEAKVRAGDVRVGLH